MDLDDYRCLAEAHYKARVGIARQLRKDANLSMAEIAAVVGVSESAISRWETGNRQPRGEAALRWARLLAKLERVQSVATAA